MTYPDFIHIKPKSRLLLCLLLLLVCAAAAFAEDVSVSATLSDVSTPLGEPVELQITVQGTQKAAIPELRVPGLEIQYQGASSQVQMNNFDVTRSVKHTYIVLPLKEGAFQIPAIEIEAGGKKLSTRALKLVVGAGASGAQPGAPAKSADTASANQQFAFAEWVLPKTSAYVGESLPVELRLYIQRNLQCQLQQMPSLTGDGFTAQKMPAPKQRDITKDGRELTLAIFKTAITPAKSGKLTLPAVDINLLAVLPSKRQRGTRLPGFPDVFNDPFFGGAFNATQQVTIRPETAELEVKPLPSTGKPKSFSGAVGQFTLETKAAPLRVRAGDPVTVTAGVKGVGSFDRMSAPAVAEEPGWRAYPPSGKFTPDDDVGISGEKVFEMALIPETAKSELPKIEFSFFNPSTGHYETLKGARTPLTVEGAPAPAPTPGAIAAAPTPGTPVPTPTPQPKASDIQYIRVDSGRWGVTFEPVWRTRDFWLAQGVALAALLSLTGWKWQRSRMGDETARRAARLRREKAEAWRALKHEGIGPAEFYSAAIRLLQTETVLGQLRTEREPAAVDADAACASRPLDCETEAGVRRVFAAYEELSYAGIGASTLAEPVHADRRHQVLQLLEQFEKCHA